MAARIRIRDASGVLRTITQIRARDAGGTLRTIDTIRARDTAGILRTVFSSGGGGGGGGGALDTQTVTVAADGSAIDNDRRRGFITGVLGGCSDGTSNLYSGAAVRRLCWDENVGAEQVHFEVNGVVANSGWTTMDVAGTSFSRASATYSNPGGNSRWAWSTAANPFGTSGTKVVEFT